MPSSVGHAFAALTIGTLVLPPRTPVRVWTTGAAGAVLLDVDAIGRPFGYHDVAWLGGHRGLTHSILFAIAVAAILILLTARQSYSSTARARLFAFFALAMIAHGCLDAFTTYGGGVAFFAPLSWRRFESSWEPFRGLWPEVIALWMPSAILLALRASIGTREDSARRETS